MHKYFYKQDIRDIKYESLISLQEKQKKESSMIIYDTASRSKFHGVSATHLLAYMIRNQPWTISFGVDVENEGALGIVDAEWHRDSHAVSFISKSMAA